MIPRSSTHKYYHQHGFTLVELAVVLVIMGMLLSVGMSMIGPLTKRAKTIESKEILNSAAEGVAGFAANPANGRLANVAEFTTQVRNVNDAYGKPLQYIWSNNLNANICGRTFTNITVRECFNLACAAANRRDITNVAYVVLSSGENYNNQTAPSSPPGPGPPLAGGAPAGTIITTYQMGALTPGTPVDNYAGDNAANNFPTPAIHDYDDIVKWVTLDELKMKMGCSTALRIINSSIPAASQGTIYSSTAIVADGGVPNGTQYRWCIDMASAADVPPGITFTAPTRTNPLTCATLARANWNLASQMTIAGTPTIGGAYRFTVNVRDNNDPPPGSGANDNFTAKQFNMVVDSQFKILTNDLIAANLGNIYSANILATGGIGLTTAYRWCVESNPVTNPPGLAFNTPTVRLPGACTQIPNNWAATSQLQLTGTPTTPGTYTFTAFARDSATPPNNNLVQKQFSLTVNSTPLKLTVSDPLPAGKVGAQYATAANPLRILAEGGVPFATGVYGWCVQKNPAVPPLTPPTGLTFTPANLFNANCATRLEAQWPQATQIAISGTPTVAASNNYIIFVRDNLNPAGATDNITQKAYNLTIVP